MASWQRQIDVRAGGHGGEPVLALCASGELFGGVERHLLGMCTWLQRRGIPANLILMHDRELADQARRQGVKPIILSSRHGWDLQAPRRLARLLRDMGANVVHAHNERATVTVALARRYYDFAMVRTVHGAIEPGSDWTPAGFKKRFYPWLERTICRSAAAAVCYVTEDLRHHWQAEKHDTRSLVIHNGIDPLVRGSFTPPEGWPPDAVNYVIVGRISEVKGIPFALKALTSIPADIGIHLHIVGAGPCEAEYRELAVLSGLETRVTFHGFRSNIYDYMAHADALLMPSLHEGLPFTILEALSLGVPIIASAVGGLAEVLRDRDTACLVPVGDTEAIAARMREVAENAAEAAAMGQRGRQMQVRKLNLECMGAAHWHLYREVLSQAGRS